MSYFHLFTVLIQAVAPQGQGWGAALSPLRGPTGPTPISRYSAYVYIDVRSAAAAPKWFIGMFVFWNNMEFWNVRIL